MGSGNRGLSELTPTLNYPILFQSRILLPYMKRKFDKLEIAVITVEPAVIASLLQLNADEAKDGSLAKTNDNCNNSYCLFFFNLFLFLFLLVKRDILLSCPGLQVIIHAQLDKRHELPS